MVYACCTITVFFALSLTTMPSISLLCVFRLPWIGHFGSLHSITSHSSFFVKLKCLLSALIGSETYLFTVDNKALSVLAEFECRYLFHNPFCLLVVIKK